MTLRARWAQIPEELRRCAQWCYTFPQDPKPERRKAPRKKGNILASDTKPSDWMSFEEACEHAEKVRGDIGFILTENDPFTCIDLDVKNCVTHPDTPGLWTTQKDMDRYWDICKFFDSYTEKSQSGNGLHIWLMGNIGRGARRDGVEVYSQERFIICTGDIVLRRPIKLHQENLELMVGDMRNAQVKPNEFQLIEVEEELADHELIDIAMSAGNAEKFNALCSCTSCDVISGGVKVHGSYAALGYASQSEADLALMSIFTFYSKSNEQCKRLFRMSGLGKRDKALKNERYLNDTLKTIRARQALEDRVELVAIAQSADTLTRLHQEKKARELALLHVPGAGNPTALPAPAAASVAALAPTSAATGSELAWPPGLAGQMAYYIYRSAPRPVKEVAIVSALGLLAGICGKAFNIPQSGLNLYIVLIARSAVGKEAMHSGVSNLISAASARQPPAMKFVDFSDFASGPALKKAVAANQSFVNVAGEWGHKLSRLAAENGRDTPMSQLRHVMTDLYQKSASHSIVGGISYSNKESNISSVSGVAYSMIGESTPKRFYESLTEDMMEDGFMSRFLVVEYQGDRPPLNTQQVLEPPKALGDAVADLCTHALTLLDRHESVRVDRTEVAAIMLRNFEIECDLNINGTTDEMWRQMWNRAALKVMRISALLAVAENWFTPIIDEPHVAWALEIVRRDIKVMSNRIMSGDIGNSDDSRERKLAQYLQEFMEARPAVAYKVPDSLHKNNIVPRKYLQQRVARSNLFNSGQRGTTSVLDSTLRSMVDNGYLMEVDKNRLMDQFGFSGRAFRILSIPDYGAK